ncbi:MAG: TonB-dependent receptor [Terricaulis sp.]
MQRTCVFAIVLAGAAGLAGQAGADTIDRSALEGLFDEPVTLSATGAPQRVTDAPVNMTIISQDDIRRSGAIDLPGVLERLANVDVMRTSAGQADVSIRGYNGTFSPRLLVLLNGRQVYLDEYGMTNWETIPVQLSEIRQIEVVSGPNTALFGFNAVAGVVNIITYEALSDDVDAVMVRAGSQNYAGGSAVWTGRVSNDLGVRVSLGAANTDALPGDDTIARAFLGADSVDPMTRTAAINAAYNLNEHVHFDLEATWSRNEGTDRYTTALFSHPYETNSLKAAVSAETELGLVDAQIYSNFLEHDLENRTTVTALSLVSKPAPAHIVRIAGEYRRNSLVQGGGELVYNVRSLSGMWNWQANSDLAFTSAARFDALDLERSGSFISPDFPFTNADYDQSFTEWSFNLGALYRISERDALRFSAARGVGSPGLIEYGYELGVTPAPGTIFFVAGDPSAAPTIVYNLELGWDHEIHTIDGRVRAALFWQKNENLRSFGSRSVVYSVTPTFVSALLPQPVGDSEMGGFEIGVEGRRGRYVWDAQYSWRDIEDALTVSPVDVETSYEATSPEHVFTAGVTWLGDRFEAGVDTRYTSETMQYGRGAQLIGLFPVEAYVQANARVAWRLTNAVELEVSGRNLLESQTQTVGMTPVERGGYVTLRATF